MDAGIALVDLVDEQDAGDFLVFQLAQNELELRHLFLVHLADDDGDVDRRQHGAHVVDEFDRARAVEEHIGIAHEIRGGGGELDAHAVMARFLAGVADRVAGFDGALALDRAGAGEDRFQERGLAALKRTDQRDAAWTGRSCAIAAVRRHGHLPRLPLVPARPPETYRFRRRRGWSRGATPLAGWRPAAPQSIGRDAAQAGGRRPRFCARSRPAPRAAAAPPNGSSRRPARWRRDPPQWRLP